MASTYTPILNYLRSKGMDTSMNNIKQLAAQLGFPGYTGTDADNNRLAGLLTAAPAAPTPQPTYTPPTPAPQQQQQPPVTPSMYDGIIAGNPFLSSQLQNPETRRMFDSLPPDLQAIYLQTATSLGKTIESGKVVNPNIELTPAENQKLLEQARAEIDPYYQEKITGMKQDFQTSISRLMEDYNKGVTRRADQFKTTLEDQAETEADRGLAFSSGRKERLDRTINLENNALSDAATSLTRTGEDQARSLERNIGTSGLRSLNIPGLTTYSASESGYNPSGSRDLFAPLGNVNIGEVGKAQTVDEAQRKSQLETAFRANRVLDLSKLS